ncbi:MAG: M23 family metallopeptidase [Spirochaetales bacterium]|nr:M23 family metallopeptidase [Leptospiraceae bacterium]MCP5480669.1 M23 family metallopeptidase [Spirochaetales bacterium]MCP5484021.1 M23 family metallopeptidase [Spirochaetales bacterium]
MKFREKGRWWASRLSRWFERRRSDGWAGISILVLKPHRADRPVRLRINYYILGFVAALLLVLPAVGAYTLLRRNLQSEDTHRTVEDRRGLLTSLRYATDEKRILLGFVEIQIEGFRSMAYPDEDSLIGRIRELRRPSTAGEEEAVTQPAQDTEGIRRVRDRSLLVLDDAAYHSLHLLWNRMTVYYQTPRGRPLAGGSGQITSLFGSRDDPFHQIASKHHPGVDFGDAPGTPIVATAPGIVVRAVENDPGGYGKYVTLHHGFGVTSLYAHCRGLAVQRGERVRRGQVIAYLGRTGRATGHHVHYEVRLGADPAIDPMQYIQLP